MLAFSLCFDSLVCIFESPNSCQTKYRPALITNVRFIDFPAMLNTSGALALYRLDDHSLISNSRIALTLSRVIAIIVILLSIDYPSASTVVVFQFVLFFAVSIGG